MNSKETSNIPELLAGRARYYRDCGHVKSARITEMAIGYIENMRQGHKAIVTMLLDRLTRQGARLRTSIEVLTSEAERHVCVLKAEQARSSVLEEELTAEREMTAALNARLVEFEHGGEGERADAWRAVAQTLTEVCPGWADPDMSGTQCALAAIRALAGRAAASEAYGPLRQATAAPDPAPTAEQGQQEMTREGAFLRDVGHECRRARAKHPGTEAMGNALAEETGEVMQALADEPAENVYTECVQVASTAMRIALEGDRAVDFVRARHGLDALPGSPFAGFDGSAIRTPHDLRTALTGRLTIRLCDRHGMADAAVLAHELAGEVTATLGKWLGENPTENGLPSL